MTAEGPATQVFNWWDQRHDGETTALATDDPKVAGCLLRALIDDGLLALPRPGSGGTWERFQSLTALGEVDLTVGRLAEAHCDALAILAELGNPAGDEGSVWAVWAAEPPNAKVEAVHTADGEWTLSGRKAWCSGAGIADRALVTAESVDGPRLLAVTLDHPGVSPVDDPWPAPALSGTDTRSVDFDDVAATAVGAPGDYTARPGFWFGAAGVAAVWYGGSRGVAARLLQGAKRRELGDIDRAHLGAVVAALAAADGVLFAAATAFDNDSDMTPAAAEIVARSARAVVEDAAGSVVEHVGRALGPGPLALDGSHARRVADLQLYLRQSHAERDLAELGARVIESGRLP